MYLPGDETFGGFYPGNNEVLLRGLQETLSKQQPAYFYLWGDKGAGKTHLLHAACADRTKRADPVLYLPLKAYRRWSPSLLEGVEALSLVCIDDLDSIAGQKNWEYAIFDMYNRMLETGRSTLLIVGQKPSQQLGLELPDLISRLSSGQTYKVTSLDDSGKLEALKLRAYLRGFSLPEEVAAFLLNRLNRETDCLFAALNRLDGASIRAQRKLTIPFVKSVLCL